MFVKILDFLSDDILNDTWRHDRSGLCTKDEVTESGHMKTFIPKLIDLVLMKSTLGSKKEDDGIRRLYFILEQIDRLFTALIEYYLETVSVSRDNIA